MAAVTWSAEELFVRAYGTAAVAVQAVLDAGRKLTLTRMRPGSICASRFPTDRRTSQASTLGPRTGPCPECNMSGARGTDICNRCKGSGFITEWLPDADDDKATTAEEWRAAFANQTVHAMPMPSTLDDVVAQLCQLTYFVEDIRNIIQASPAASTAGDPSPTIASAAPQCAVDGEGSSADSGIPQPPAGERTDFAKGVDAAANIVAGEAQRVWREVLDSPDARPVMDGMSVAFGFDRLTQELRDHANEYSHPDDAAAEWIGGAVPVITAVLARHHPVDNPVCAGAVSCIDPDGAVHDEFGSQREWREFAARMIADRLAPQLKPAFPETGLDMGARLDGASEFFPQHRNSK